MKIFYIVLGFICIGLGGLGIVLPILPTTPFLLAAVYCFMQGSPRLHQWFIQTKLYKKHLQSFHESRALTAKTKATILAFASTLLLIGFYFSPPIAKVIIVLLMVIKYWFFLFWIKTAPTTE